MAGTSVTKHNFINNNTFLTSLVADLTTAGFTKVFPTDAYNPANHQVVVMQATVTVDTLAGPTVQPWRIALRRRSNTVSDAAYQCLDFIIGTPATIKDDGTLSTIYKSSATQTDTQPAGLLGSGYSSDTIVKTDSTHRRLVWWSRADRDSTAGTDSANPFSYKLTTTSRGIALHVWEPGTVLGFAGRGPISSTVVIQRLVDNSTGAPITTGKAPLQVLYCLDNNFSRMVLRESDILTPSLAIDAEVHTSINVYGPASQGADLNKTIIDSGDVTGFGAPIPKAIITSTLTGGLYPPIINNRSYIAITEDNNYVTTFPSGFCTSRYAYYGEMDMIAYTSADIVAPNAIIQFTAYGESTPRKYQAMSATGPDASKLRILQLIDGGDTVFTS